MGLQQLVYSIGSSIFKHGVKSPRRRPAVDDASTSWIANRSLALPSPATFGSCWRRAPGGGSSRRRAPMGGSGRIGRRRTLSFESTREEEHLGDARGWGRSVGGGVERRWLRRDGDSGRRRVWAGAAPPSPRMWQPPWREIGGEKKGT